MLDLLSAILGGALVAGFGFLALIWCVEKAYQLGFKDAKQGRSNE